MGRGGIVQERGGRYERHTCAQQKEGQYRQKWNCARVALAQFTLEQVALAKLIAIGERLSPGCMFFRR